MIAVALLLATLQPLHAVEPGEQLKDPVLERGARALSTGLRCLVCQNETIDESGASLARDIRMLLREHLAAGDTDAQAVSAIVDRYGEFVLLNPPVRPATYVSATPSLTNSVSQTPCPEPPNWLTSRTSWSNPSIQSGERVIRTPSLT